MTMYDWLPDHLPRPVYRKTVATFHGPDPWRARSTVLWMLAIYQLGVLARAESFNLSAENPAGDLPRGFALGLFSRQSNEVHLIPYSLRRLWQQGHVAIEALPAVLHRSEREGVIDEEFVPTGDRSRVSAAWMSTFGLVLLAAGPLIWFWAGRLEAAILCGFFGAIIAGTSLGVYWQYWRWKRRQNRFTQHWIYLAREA